MMPENKPKISIIIPVYNEETHIKSLAAHIRENAFLPEELEILIIDGGSTDESRDAALKTGLKVVSSPKGRAMQMNRGAAMAQADILYFLHVDTFPPSHFDKAIRSAIRRGEQAGCFRMRFDSKNRFLQFFAWFSRFNHKICRGGDQSLFITRKLFYELGGFDESYTVYEDSEFINRIYKETPFKILPESVVTSARRYEDHGAVSLQYHFGMIHVKNWLGAGPEQLYSYYKRNIGA